MVAVWSVGVAAVAVVGELLVSWGWCFHVAGAVVDEGLLSWGWWRCWCVAGVGAVFGWLLV